MNSKTVSGIILTILFISVSFLSLFITPNFVRDVQAGTTYTFYTSASDSYIWMASDNYTIAWTATSGWLVNFDPTLGVGQSSPSLGILPVAQYEIWRTYFYFNTTSLPANLNIQTAVLTIYINAFYVDTNFNITVQNGQPTYPHDPCIHADFDKTKYFGNGGQLSTAGLTTGFNDIVLNPTGISWINSGGWTKFCLRSDRDIEGIPPTKSELVSIISSRYNGGIYRAKLTIQHTARTWIVDDDGPADFHIIQEAINHANKGDTIFVRNGTYSGPIVIDKTLTLEGENRETTIIDGGSNEPSGSIVLVTADNVKISGFTIQHCREGGNAIWIDGYVNMTFSDNIITGNNEGIRILHSSGNIISHNIVQDCYYNTGLGLNWAYNNIVYGNIIDNCNVGIGGNHWNNTFFENIISGSHWMGISDNFQDCVFFHNNIINNGVVNSNPNPNVWDDGYPSGGNYWSDYTDVDLYSGPYQNETGSDGIWDHPYVIDEQNQDNYPLMEPWTPTPPVITAIVDIHPQALNLRSKGRWITCYIELSQGYDVNDINVSTVMLNDTVPAELHPTEVGDYDNDTIPDLMVKFDRAEVTSYILNNVNMTKLYEEKFMTITLTLTGKLNDETPFQGSGTIKITLCMPKGLGRYIFPI